VNLQEYVGREFAPFTFDVERSQLRLFAKAIGESRPMYTDIDAARAAGYRDLPAPATFPFSIGMNPEDPFDMVKALGVDLATVLHGEQSFEYVRPICAGDCVRVRREVVEAYQKKGGALTFFVVALRYEDAQSGDLFCTARQVIVSRSEAPAHG
jgi:acyl dehydratase